MRFETTVPFTRRQALAAGIGDGRLRSREFVKVLGGVYVSAAAPLTPALRARAALSVHPVGAVATHATAARLVGAPVPADPCEHVTVASAEDRRQRQGIRCHVAALAAHDVIVLEGLRLSSPHRMFVELAGPLALVDLVVLGDWLVRSARVTCESLRQYCRSTQARYARRAANAAAYVRDGVDSPMETRLRLLIVLSGLPEPEVSVALRDDHGHVLALFDLAYRGVRVALEYDGQVHVEDARQRERDIERREDVDGTGWRMIVVTRTAWFRHPEQILERVYDVLSSRGYPALARPTDAWRAHFAR